MARIQGLSDTPQVLTGQELLKTGDGFVFTWSISWSGATAGNKIYLRDGTDGTGKAICVHVVDGAAGSFQYNWPQGLPFSTGLFYDEGAPANAESQITYK